MSLSPAVIRKRLAQSLGIPEGAVPPPLILEHLKNQTSTFAMSPIQSTSTPPSPSSPVGAKTFKLGDTVKIIKNESNHSYPIGYIGKITNENEGSAESPCYRVDYQPANQVLASDMELFEPSIAAVIAATKNTKKEGEKKKMTFDSVVLPTEKREEIKAAISQIDNTNLIFDTWGFSEVFEKGTAITLLFWGIPGSGKTLMAQAIAEELGAELKIYGMAEIGTSEPGGSERFIKKIFKEAKEFFTREKKHQVVLFDECDALLYDRNKVGVILGAQINTLLTEIERHDGIIIFTTNRVGTLDPALERRIAAKIEFPFPDEKARLAIWKRMIPSQCPLNKDVKFADLAKYSLAGGNIKNAVLNAVRMAAYKKQKTITMNNFVTAVEKELSSLKTFEKRERTNRENGWDTKPLSATDDIVEDYGVRSDRSVSVHQSLNSKYDDKRREDL